MYDGLTWVDKLNGGWSPRGASTSFVHSAGCIVCSVGLNAARVAGKNRMGLAAAVPPGIVWWLSTQDVPQAFLRMVLVGGRAEPLDPGRHSDE